VPNPAGSDRPLVIGLGHDDRSDDGAGLDVVRWLREHGRDLADLREGPGDLTGLLDVWAEHPYVVLIDAMQSGASPGAIRRWEGEEALGLPSAVTVSSHGLALPDVLRLARDLHRLPPHLVVFGIEASATGYGRERSPAVRTAIPATGQRIVDELSARGGGAAVA